MGTISLEEWAQLLQKDAPDRLQEELGKVLATFALRVEGKAKRNATYGSIRVRSGRLRQSIRGAVLASPSLEVHLMAGGRAGAGQVTYAGIQEHGGRVDAKGKKLRVPLDAAKTAAGVDRYGGIPLRSVGGFFVIKSKRGNLLLVRKNGKSITPWYVLVDSVTVKGSRFLGRALDWGVKTQLPGPLGDAFRVSLSYERT